MLFNSILENPNDITFTGEDSDEKILYVFRQSFLTNIPWIFCSLILGILPPFLVPLIPSFINTSFIFAATLFWYLIIFGYSFQNFLNWFFNVYIISDKKIVDVDFQGILYKKISEAPLKSIEDVTSTIKGVFGIVFNIGNVYIQTAAENREFEFDALDDPSKVRDIISDLASKKKGHF